jgi:hypothetical protein
MAPSLFLRYASQGGSSNDTAPLPLLALPPTTIALAVGLSATSSSGKANPLGMIGELLGFG